MLFKPFLDFFPSLSFGALKQIMQVFFYQGSEFGIINCIVT